MHVTALQMVLSAGQMQLCKFLSYRSYYIPCLGHMLHGPNPHVSSIVGILIIDFQTGRVGKNLKPPCIEQQAWNCAI